MAEDGIDLIREILVDVELSQFLLPIRDDLQITRLEHFDYVRTEDLEKIGLSKPGNHSPTIYNSNYHILQVLDAYSKP